MEARTETGKQCCVDEKCRLAPCNLCIMCLGSMCDGHADSRMWSHVPYVGDGSCIKGYLCLNCVPGNTEISDSPQLVQETRMTISLEDCMRLQRVLENLK